ncbi:MAG: undecaprenyl-diphosphate phosphatase [Flavobacteriales bacterium]
MNLLQAIIIAIVEGLTEFLPISSTGHMIIAQHLLGAPDDDFTKIFVITIQFAAILSVVLLYWKRFFQSLDFYFKLLVAFIPAAVLGLLLNDYIEALLESVMVVAVMLFVGGIVLIMIDKYLNPKNEVEVTYPKAFKVGLFQCIAMIPGVSRSAATIIGGMAQGLTRKQAAEFSFFLAVPTMFGASVLQLYKGLKDSPDVFTSENIKILAVGNVVAFIVAVLAIKGFIAILTKFGFKGFGYYRIILGLLLIVLLCMGVDLQITD